MGILYIVSTPIGNIKDISQRALEVLAGVDLILAEDTRRTGHLLNKCNLNNRLESFFEHNEEGKIDGAVEKLKSGQKIALVSDAGTPLLSDPGYKLVRECIKEGVKVESIPGPSAILTALTSSGLPTDQFLFIGYFPKKTGKQKETLNFIEKVTSLRPTTIIIFESPFRVEKTINLLASNFPDKDIVISRELTKQHEEMIRGKVKDVANKKFVKKGEFTLLLR